MAALFADVSNVALQKLIAGIGLSIRQPNGSIKTAYTDRSGVVVNAEVPAALQASLGRATEFELVVRVNPDGQTAWAKVLCKTPQGSYDIEGQIDTTVLATKLV